MKKKILAILPLLAVGTLSACGVKVNTAHTTTVEVDTETVEFKEEYQEQTSFEINLPEKETIPEEEIDGRFVDETWREYSVYICYKSETDTKKYYTAEPGDYITNIRYESALISKRPVIDFHVNFYMWDDLEVEFIFDNDYTTGVRKYRSCICSKDIKISKADDKKYDLKNHYISKIRVRTLD